MNNDRRQFCRSLSQCLAGVNIAAGMPSALFAGTSTSSSAMENIPAIGMGTWITFDVPPIENLRRSRASVLQTFFELGGTMVDSSPMYGHAESVLGDVLERIKEPYPLFAASKIWTPSALMGRQQMSDTESLWGVRQMDLMYVHNLLGWRKHLPRLRKWKNEGRIRYIGVTTSHGRRHKELENVLKNEPIDFVQLTYNIEDTEVEQRLLPLAQDRGVAVVANRPFKRGALFSRYASQPLPELAIELGCNNWAHYFLLYVVSHPAIHCAIPATSRVEHMRENMGTLKLDLPDNSVRAAMRASIIG